MGQMLGAVGVAVFLQLAAFAPSEWWATAWMSLALLFGRMQSMGYWVNMVDVCPETASTIMGMSNTVATIPGIVGQPITLAILDRTGSWSTVYGIGGAVGV